MASTGSSTACRFRHGAQPTCHDISQVRVNRVVHLLPLEVTGRAVKETP